MPSLLVRLLLFLSSYFPLAVIFFVFMLTKNRIISILILSIGTVGLIGISVYISVAKKLNATKVEVMSVSRRDGEAMSYIVTYLLPFFAVPINSLEVGICLGIFFIVLGILYISSDMIHINPMLNIAGYHIYEIELANGNVYSLISKKRIRRGLNVSVVKAGEYIYLEV